MLRLCVLFATFAFCSGQVYKFLRNQTLSYPNHQLKSHVISEFTTKHLVTQCAMECFGHHQCVSFNFAEENHICQLNDATHEDFPNNFDNDSSEYDYHLRESFSVDPVSTSHVLLFLKTKHFL